MDSYYEQEIQPERNFIRWKSTANAVFLAVIIMGAFHGITDAKAPQTERNLTEHDYNVYFFPLYYPFGGEENSWVRSFTSLGQLVLLFPQILVLNGFPLLFYVITAELHNKFEILRNNITTLSNLIIHVDDEMQQLEEEGTYLTTKRTRYNLLKSLMKANLENFRQNFAVHIRRYQNLIKALNLLRSCLQHYCALYYVMVFVLFVCSGYLFVLPMKNQIRDTETIIAWITFDAFIALFWLCICYIGTLFENMNAKMAEELHMIPWYRLGVSDRRTYLVFLILAQRPMQLLTFKLYPINLATFPQTMNTFYSYIQTLEVLKHAYHLK